MDKIDHFVKKAELLNLKAFGITLMGHGNEDLISTFGSTELKISEMITTVQLAHALRNVPKLFFIQACRGHTMMQPVTSYNNRQVPLRSDTLIYYATYQGHVSVRLGVSDLAVLD